MPFRYVTSRRIWDNKSFMLFLISQGIFNLGDSFYFIAVTIFLMRITGSGISAGFITVCTPISSLLLSSFAGSLGDRFHEKHLLVFLDMLRGLMGLCFIVNSNVWMVYILMFALSLLEILSNPPRKKVIVSILKEHEIMIGNSLLSGVAGATFLIGPTIAGIVLMRSGADTVFLLSSLLFFISAFLRVGIRTKSFELSVFNRRKSFLTSIREDIHTGIEYVRHTSLLKDLVFMATIVCMSTASINMAIYAFVFDGLRVTSREWGIMISVFYGASFMSMVVSILFRKIISQFEEIMICVFLISISCIWFLYTFVETWLIILFLQFIEGINASLFIIILNTQLQTTSKKDFVARVIGINDTLNNIGKLLGICCTYIILKASSFRTVFGLNALVLACFALYKLCAVLLGISRQKMSGGLRGMI